MYASAPLIARADLPPFEQRDRIGRAGATRTLARAAVSWPTRAAAELLKAVNRGEVALY